MDRLIINCPEIIQLRTLALGFRDAIKGHDLQKDISAVTAAREDEMEQRSWKDRSTV